MSTAMERYQGVILIRLQNAGSKSEGHYAFLVRDDDMSVVKLCREGAVPADDPYFVPFDRQEVVVTGTMSHGAVTINSPILPASATSAVATALRCR